MAKTVKWRTPYGTDTVPAAGNTTTEKPTEAVIPEGVPAAGDDPVNHPPQYTQGEVECIDAIDSAITELPPDEAVCVANVIKYVWRYRRKSPVESLKKARWYLDRLIGKMETRYAECLPTKGEPIHVDVQHRI